MGDCIVFKELRKIHYTIQDVFENVNSKIHAYKLIYEVKQVLYITDLYDHSKEAFEQQIKY